MLETGLRLEECRNIDFHKDVDWQRSLVKVLGKGSKVRWVPLTPLAAQTLRDQCSESGRLWPETQCYFRDYLKRAAKRAEIPHISPHALRHSFGTRWIQGGGDIYVLSKILGHSSVMITEKHYSHILDRDVVRAVHEMAERTKNLRGLQGVTNVVALRLKKVGNAGRKR